MNHVNDSLKLDDDRLLDRLVDGELAETERRALLIRLEAEPGGWRRCALAFLEAQCWREVFGPIASTTDKPAAVPGVPVVLLNKNAAQLAGSSRVPRVLHIAVRAAAVFLAFGLGLLVGGARRTDTTGTEMVHRGPVKPDRNASPALPSAGGQEAASSSGLPLREVSESDKNWLAELPPAVPAYLQRQWEQRGYRVETRRQLVPGSLADGRRVAIPVDQVKLHYVGQPVY